MSPDKQSTASKPGPQTPNQDGDASGRKDNSFFARSLTPQSSLDQFSPQNDERVTPPDKSHIPIEMMTLDGYLLKKSSNFLVGWQRRYFVLQNDQLRFYDDENKEVEKGSLNLRTTKCELKECGGLEFQINIEGTKNKLRLRAYKEADYRVWKTILSETFESFGRYRRSSTVTDKPWKVSSTGCNYLN
eukprot:TRINITY_DN4338_c0_g1_i3.p1 TRINITY_DN4338_c0_g1~~TRINITY_DN4338_c0_g1_i3.p1  ORF type:complete len:188 (+),score=44.90 TRINITY_DN4338_c0_g1_i3:108-671(+)